VAPDFLPRACCRKGCKNSTTDGTWVCTECRAADAEQHRDRDALRKRTNETTFLRNKRAWRDRVSPAVLAHNPICQRLGHNGEQCRRPSRVVHHLKAPGTDAKKFFDIKNLIALCSECHPSSEGTPDWKPGVDFVPTEFKLAILGESPSRPRAASIGSRSASEPEGQPGTVES